MVELLEFHPLANLFPLMTGTGFDDLVSDVRAKGIQEPIVLFEGRILDGRNRYRAAAAAGSLPAKSRFFDAASDGSPLAFVLSKNLHRRHLTTSQRALVAARLAQLGRGRPSDPAFASTEAASATLKVSARTIERARDLLKRGAPALLAQVETGRLSISAASRIARMMPEASQAEAVSSGRSLVAVARRSRAHAGLSGRREYAGLWSLVDRICDGLEAGRLDMADVAAREFSRAVIAVTGARS